jgi:hypothetical protein
MSVDAAILIRPEIRTVDGVAIRDARRERDSRQGSDSLRLSLWPEAFTLSTRLGGGSPNTPVSSLTICPASVASSILTPSRRQKPRRQRGMPRNVPLGRNNATSPGHSAATAQSQALKRDRIETPII